MSDYVDSVKRALEFVKKSADAVREKSPEAAAAKDAIAKDLSEALEENELLERLTKTKDA